MATPAFGAYHDGMTLTLTADDHLLLDRYLDSVLIRHAEGTYDLETARAELAEAFKALTQGEAGFRTHIQAVLDAGDDA